MTRRIIVTGSREWTDVNAVVLAITEQFLLEPFQHLTVVHGKAHRGLDAIAHRVCEMIPDSLTPEPHPADWEAFCDLCPVHRQYRKDGTSYCPMAGHYRNQEMVDAGAEVVLAFPLGKSTGTRDCMARAVAAGIRVLNYGDDEPTLF